MKSNSSVFSLKVNFTMPWTGQALVLFSTLVLLFALVLSTPAQAGNPYTIDGTLPDCADCDFPDPSGSVQELGPLNGADTKIGVINDAATPMMDFTSVAPKVDLTVVYFDKMKDTSNDDIWLYFAWKRDSTTGSGVLAIEIGENAPPEACDFSNPLIDQVKPESPAETDLINDCNPWENRITGDRLLVWDQVGQDIVISIRTYDGVQWGAPQMLDPTKFEAALNDDNSGGEAAINLSKTILDPAKCTSVGNIIPSTITGNSDTADYKDTVLADIAGLLKIATCGDVIIRKETTPDGDSTVFSFTHNLNLEGDPDPTSFDLKDGEDESFLVFENGGYTVSEAVPAGWDLDSIDCSKSSNETLLILDKDTDPATGDPFVKFNVAVGETVDCTFNNVAKAKLTLKKDVDNKCDVSDGGLFILSANGMSSDPISDGESYGPLELTVGTYTVSEAIDTTTPSPTALTDYITILSGATSSDTACPTGMGTTSGNVTLGAGDDVTCLFTNIRIPTVTVTKVLVGGGAGNFDLLVDGNTKASGVGNNGTTGAVPISRYKPSTGVFGPDDGVVVSEVVNSGGTFQTLWSCDNGTSGTGLSLNIGTLLPGEDVTCTVTNVPLQAGDSCPLIP